MCNTEARARELHVRPGGTRTRRGSGAGHPEKWAQVFRPGVPA